ncbi:peptidoglycan DD-metalloendopeptidase family protein [Adhaeribacter rhizoryzae]|uniref:Peptidoglycan DD-metalloendopeptidase family protein n=1 Tax=Adhaeribacter rhizoryzae TaxID=2607907 RepID=A0A5M6D140_9BACT|nr:peptidoglycan DD-metalloendopeptidase family protein [Adhaeribacter rhizoryzae]KAA5541217.1 peptidoglycan DD-metalloendopeptidase family protein [Adhaeribacter rhizoryzae]
MIKQRKGLAILIVLSLLLYISAAQVPVLDITSVLAKIQPTEKPATTAPPAAEKITPPAPIVYGIPTDSLEIVESEVERGETVSSILGAYNISPVTIHELALKAKNIFNLKRIQPKRNYILLHTRDSAQTAQYFIYEPNEREYIIYDLRDSLQVTRHKREMQIIERELAGEIKGSLYESVLAAGGSAQLVDKLADIYAWRLNLNHMQPGDQFKLIFEEKQINGSVIGYGALKAAFFQHNGQPLYAIAFDQGNGVAYYDQDGKSFKKAFLKEPLEYSRVSSRYTMRRFHPVQKRFKAHLGTDFAAPRGTPIRSVGEGVILDAAYARGNGYFVKIRHNKTYTTQYLHLSKFAKGIRRGKTVQQGQTIGYVGSTGLSTGPHLCYRLWKNGKQVDALKVKLPLAEPVNRKSKKAFLAAKEEIVKRLEALNLNQPNENSGTLVASDNTKAAKKS